MGNYDEGTSFDAEECDCAYTNPVEEPWAISPSRGPRRITSDANTIWLRSLAREITSHGNSAEERHLA